MQNRFIAYFIRNVEEQSFVYFNADANTAQEAMNILREDGFILVMTLYSTSLVSVPYHNIAYVGFIGNNG